MHYTAECLIVGRVDGVADALEASTAGTCEASRVGGVGIASMRGHACEREQRGGYQFCDTIHAIPAAAMKVTMNSGVIGAQPSEGA